MKLETGNSFVFLGPVSVMLVGDETMRDSALTSAIDIDIGRIFEK